MKTYCKINSRYILLPFLFYAGVMAQAGESGGMEIPYTPPLELKGRQPAESRETAPDLYGRVVQTMDSGGYTYVLLDTDGQKVWAAGPVTRVKKGDAVKISTNMPMQHFHSKSLKRNFDLVYFSNAIVVAGKAGLEAGRNPHQGMMQQTPDVPLTGVKKARGGKTIAEIYHGRKQLAGKRVRVRGKVVKFIGNIYGKNWIHIQDSSSQKSLLVISGDRTRSAVVLVEGTVVLNKDNGIGHVYEVVLDDARLIAE